MRECYAKTTRHGQLILPSVRVRACAGLVFGIVLPLAAALRFPGLVIVALRTVFFLPALWVRFVPWELQVAIYAGMWKRYVEWNRSTRGSSRGQQQQQRRKKGSRPWDKPS